jgi:AcrR family transcriptional regulator
MTEPTKTTETTKKAPYHHRNLREALVTAGRTLLEERGMRGFTLRECARRAEVSHAAPAHHFASLDDLLAEIAARGFVELAATMTAEARRATDPASRLVGQGVGYMAFGAANPMLFRLMFSQERTEASKVVREAHFTAIAAAIPDASAEMKIRMSDFAWATVHGFIGLVLESQIGGTESARALKARGLAILSAMAETVMRAGGAPA